MMTPAELLEVQQERIEALETALQGCLQQMQELDSGRRSVERWAMACELAQQLLNEPKVIY